MPDIQVILGKTYPTDDPSILGAGKAPLIAAGELEIVTKVNGVLGEVNVYALCWDEDCEKWYPLEKLVCGSRLDPPLVGHSRFAGIKIPTERNVCLYASELKTGEIEACYVAYTPTSEFNLASPPPIGSGTPNLITGTTVEATTELKGPLGTVTAPAPVRGTSIYATSNLTTDGPLQLLNSSAPAPIANTRQIYAPAANRTTYMDAAGGKVSTQNEGSASSSVTMRTITASLGAMGASPKDITVTGGGHMIISSISTDIRVGVIGFLADGTVNMYSTPTPADVQPIDTPTSLCVFQLSPGVIRVKSNFAAGRDVLITLFEVESM
jgi:hypothetical protein